MSENRALEVLLSIRQTVAPGLSEELLKECYRIQRSNLFEDDKTIAAKQIEAAIDQHLQSLKEQ